MQPPMLEGEPFSEVEYGRQSEALREQAARSIARSARLALCLGRPTASTWACALENHAYPTSALQNDGLTLRRTWRVSYRLDVRAASGQSPRVPLHVSKPSHARVQSKQ